MWRDRDPRLLRRERLFDDRIVWCFADRPPSLQAMLEETAKRRRGADALISGDRRLSYDALWDRAARLAGALANRGVGAGDRVAILVGNRPEFVEATLACIRLGAIATPLNVRMAAPEIAYCIRNCQASALLHQCDGVDLPEMEETPSCRDRIATGPEYEGCLGASSAPMARPDECEPVFILYTSGTTGRPKGAIQSGVNVVHSVLHFQASMRLGEEERSLLAVPGSHVTGLIAQIIVMLATGGSIIMMERFRAADCLGLLADERITHSILVPAMYNLLLREDLGREVDASSWRIGGYGGAPMPQATISALAQSMPGLELFNAYGATETTSPATVLPFDYASTHSDSVGWPLHCVDIVVMDDAGREVARGEVGEICIGGPMVVSGYWDNAEATASSFAGGYWLSGDLGTIDSDGFVRVLDRKKDMINRGGYKIYSIEVENVLTAHPDVLECAVVGYPCPILGERVKAVVVTAAHVARDGLAERLSAYAAKFLSDYKVPENFVLRDGLLPRNANGKVIKSSLRS